MQLDAARVTAREAAGRLGRAFVVYRFPAWPAGVFSVIEKLRELPNEAEIVDTFTSDAEPERAPEQGGLF